jgi:hypothetical protein
VTHTPPPPLGQAHEARLDERLAALEARTAAKQAAWAADAIGRRHGWIAPFAVLGALVVAVALVALRKWRQLKKRHLL